MRFLVSTENEILLFPVLGWFEKIFSLKMKTEIQPNTFPSPFSISNENENRKQLNQTPPYLFLCFICLLKIMILCTNRVRIECTLFGEYVDKLNASLLLEKVQIL